MSVKISGNLDTKNPADVYATHLGNLTKGGTHTKDSVAAMNSIPVERRTRMMLCIVADTGSGTPGLFWLNTPINPTPAQLADNNYWEVVPLGTSIEGVLQLLGFQNGAALTITDAVGDTGDTYIADVAGSGIDPAIFNGVAYNINVGDYLVHESGYWHVVPTGATSVTWDTLTGKPSTFPATAHQHIVADITDFPDLTGHLTDAIVATIITDLTDPLFLATVNAIKVYVGEEIADIVFPTVDLSNYYTKAETVALIDAIQGYTLYVSPSLVQLAIDVPSPNENEFAYIQGEYAMYKYVNVAWELQYTTSLPSNDESLWLNSDIETIPNLKAKGTISLSLNNYTVFRNTDDSNKLNVYKLVNSADVESLPETVRPDDYATSTNEKVWKLAIDATSIGGNDKAIQYNDNGVFAGVDDFTFDSAKTWLNLDATGAHTALPRWSITAGDNINTIGAGTGSLAWSAIFGDVFTFDNAGTNRSISNILSTGTGVSITIANGAFGIYSSAFLGAELTIEPSLAGTNYQGSIIGGTYNTSRNGWQYVGGQRADVLGLGAFVHGQGENVNRLFSDGNWSINMSINTVASTYGEGANALNSAIIGGQDHHIPSDSLRSVILGGNALKMPAATTDTVLVENLMVNGALTDINGDPLAWALTGISTLTGAVDVQGGANEIRLTGSALVAGVVQVDSWLSIDNNNLGTHTIELKNQNVGAGTDSLGGLRISQSNFAFLEFTDNNDATNNSFIEVYSGNVLFSVNDDRVTFDGVKMYYNQTPTITVDNDIISKGYADGAYSPISGGDYWALTGTTTLADADVEIKIDDGRDLIISGSHPDFIGEFLGGSELHLITTTQFAGFKTWTSETHFTSFGLNNSYDAVFTQNAANAGSIKYAADYRSDFVALSLIDKGYADGAYIKTAGTSALTAGTVIDSLGYNLAIGYYDEGLDEAGISIDDANIAVSVGYGVDILSDPSPSQSIDYGMRADSSSLTFYEGGVATNYWKTAGTSTLTALTTIEVGNNGLNINAAPGAPLHNLQIDLDNNFTSEIDIAYYVSTTRQAGLRINSNRVLIDGSGSNTIEVGGDILITGEDARYAADYSGTYTDLSLIDKGYADSHLIGKNTIIIDALNTNTGPGAAEDQYVLTWDDAAGEYLLLGAGGGGWALTGTSLLTGTTEIDPDGNVLKLGNPRTNNAWIEINDAASSVSIKQDTNSNLLTFSGFGFATMYGNFSPGTADTHTLGGTSARWLNVFGATITGRHVEADFSNNVLVVADNYAAKIEATLSHSTGASYNFALIQGDIDNSFGGNTGDAGYGLGVDLINLTLNDVTQFQVTKDGEIMSSAYGTGATTGTATYMIAVDASGNIIEEALPSGGEDYLVINSAGTLPLAAGADAIAMGEGAIAPTIDAIAIGHTADATGGDTIAIGADATTTITQAIAIGVDSTVDGQRGIALGIFTDAGGTGSMAIGYNSAASAQGSIMMGYNSAATQTNSVTDSFVLAWDGNSAFKVLGGAARVNYLQIESQISGQKPEISVQGEATIGLQIRDSSSNLLLALNSIASSNSYFKMAQSASAAPELTVGGGVSNIDIRIVPLGTGNLIAVTDELVLGDSAETGTARTISAAGSGANIGLTFEAKGSNNFTFTDNGVDLYIKGTSGSDFTIASGGNSGLDLILHGADSTGAGDGGEMLIRGGTTSSGTAGDVVIEGGEQTFSGTHGVVIINQAATEAAKFLDEGIQLSGDTTQVIKTGHLQLTQGQIQALNTTPIELIAAPGSGKYIEVIGASAFLDHNGTTYGAAQAMEFKYGPSSVSFRSSFSAVFINNTGDKPILLPEDTGKTSAPAMNTNVTVTADADATGNGGTIDVYVQYAIIDTN